MAAKEESSQAAEYNKQSMSTMGGLDINKPTL
jgi:hypothetical protein